MYRELDLEEVKQAMIELNLYSNDHDLRVIVPFLCAHSERVCMYAFVGVQLIVPTNKQLACVLALTLSCARSLSVSQILFDALDADSSGDISWEVRLCTCTNTPRIHMLIDIAQAQDGSYSFYLRRSTNYIECVCAPVHVSGYIQVIST